MTCKNIQNLVVSRQADAVLISRVRCKMWTCPYCAEINKRQWQARLIDHINHSDKSWSWFTLTAHSQQRTPESSLRNLRSAWDIIMKRLKRRYGKFDYCRVYEKHASGAYHLHCIRSGWFDDIAIRQQKNGERVAYSKMLAKAAEDMKIGYYTHADNLSADRHGGYVAGYVCKYLVKLDDYTKGELGRVRHIQCSHSWPKLINENTSTWEFRTGFYIDEFLDACDEKKPVIDIQTGHTLEYADFDGTYIYPREYDHRNNDPDILPKN